MADFSEAQIQAVWELGKIIHTHNENIYRQDFAGAWMERDQYGKQTVNGWTIDHKYPESKGGDENILNLRPMQWENNDKKSDDYPSFKTSITSFGIRNIEKEQSWTENENVQQTLKELYNI